MPSRVNSEQGNVLIGILITAVMVAAFFLVYANWSSVGSKAVVNSLGMQKATYSAESGYYAALDWLKTPAADPMTLTTTPLSMGSLTEGATYQLTLQRSSLDPSLINIISTGSYAATSGPSEDWLGRRAFTAVVEAKVRVEFVRDYFAVVPGTLQIANGSDLQAGKVYGKDLIFMPGPQETKIEAAYYFNSQSVSGLVTFGDGGPPHQLASEMGAPRVTIMRDYYMDLASDAGGPCLLPKDAFGACRLSGIWTPPTNPFKVCFCDGDLVLGQAAGQPLILNGNTVIYADGNTRIENSIQSLNPPTDPPTQWIAVLSAQDVSIMATAPNTLAISGTFVTDGGMNMFGAPRATGRLTFNGGIVAQQGITLAGFQNRRVYTYQGADPSLRLPFLVQSVGWAIRKRYNQ